MTGVQTCALPIFSLCFYSNFDRESLLDAEFDSASNEYPHYILLTHHNYVFSGISCFWGSGVRQKYAMWVLVGCGIKFRIQRALPIIIRFFHVFLVFGVAGSVKSMQCGYLLDAESNSASNKLSRLKFE